MHLSKIYKYIFEGEVLGPEIIQELTLCYYSVIRKAWKSSPCPYFVISPFNSLCRAQPSLKPFPIRDAWCKIVHSRCRDSLKSNSRSLPMWSSTAFSWKDLTWPFRLSRDASPYESSPRDISERCLHISSVWKIHTWWGELGLSGQFVFIWRLSVNLSFVKCGVILVLLGPLEETALPQ